MFVIMDHGITWMIKRKTAYQKRTKMLALLLVTPFR